MGPNGVTSKADWDAVNAALGRVVASVPEETVMDVYNAVSQITDPGVPVYMKSLVNGQDAEKAYEAFLKFKDVVKANQVTAAGPAPPAAPSSDAIGAAAGKLASASYPFIKDIDWLSSIYTKPLPGVSAQQSLKAIDKAIVLGSSKWRPPAGGRGGPPQGHRQHRRQGYHLAGRLPRDPCGHRPYHRVCANIQGHGCLQRL